MTDSLNVTLSKWLSWVLRHEPQAVGLTLQDNGWVAITDLLRAAEQHGQACTRAELERVVANSEKQRFAIDVERDRIRANQGHSADIHLEFEKVTPPKLLFHGTATRFVPSIRTLGLQRGSRHHVHLSSDEDTARGVGQRHGSVIVLHVDAGRMHADGHTFWRSANGVWLVEAVAVEYLTFPEAAP